MKLTIRHATKEDYDGAHEIMKQAHKIHSDLRSDIYKMNDVCLPYEWFEKYLQEDTYIVAVSEGMIVGVLYYFIKHSETPLHVTRDVLYIDTMAVHEKYRRRGIATAMFDYIKQIAKEKNCASFELNVIANNKSAKKMYEAYGFSPKSYVMEMPVGKCDCK